MTYDDILEQIGDFGPYQKMTYYFLCTPAIMKAAIVMSTVFVLQLPKFRCAVPGVVNDTFQDHDNHHRSLLVKRVQSHSSTHQQVDLDYSQCYLYSNTTVSSEKFGNLSVKIVTENWTQEISKCNAWVYDTREVHTSILTEFNFVCDNKIMRSLTNMGFFCGSLMGSFLIGIIADVIGRKRALLLCLGIQAVFGTSLYFASSMVAVLVIRSIQGMAAEMFAISASTGMELVGPSKRTFVGVVVQLFWSSGQLLVVMVAYISKDWRISELVYGLSSVPIFILMWSVDFYTPYLRWSIAYILLMWSIAYILCLWSPFSLVPESPRWLIDKQRYQEAEKILRKIADSNKTAFTEDMFKSMIDGSVTPTVKVWKLISNRQLLVTSVVVFLNWFAVNFLYNGLSLNLNNLSGSLYVNFLISLAVEILGFLLCLILLDRTGRKYLHVTCIFIGGVACLAVNFPVVFGNEDHEWTITALVMIGKMMSSCSYSALYIMSVEIFPTCVRNSAIGVCSVFENMAAMLSPYTADMGIIVGGSLSKALPTTVFGGVAILAALLSLLLPETLHQPMPDTIEEASELFQRVKLTVKSSRVIKETQIQIFDSRL